VAVGTETHYALSGDIHIAYQLVGDGPFDLVFVPGFVTHMELQWGLPGFEQIASLSKTFTAACALLLRRALARLCSLA
jgi:hypothetical protein